MVALFLSIIRLVAL